MPKLAEVNGPATYCGFPGVGRPPRRGRRELRGRPDGRNCHEFARGSKSDLSNRIPTAMQSGPGFR